MMTMIERVARALAKADSQAGTSYELTDTEALAFARAAIAAMREPTGEMLEAPLQYDPLAIAETSLGTIDARKKYESRRDLRPHIYRTMIKAALEESL